MLNKSSSSTWQSDMVSCTRFSLYKFLAPNTAQLYSIQETCMHVTRMVSSDLSAATVFIFFIQTFRFRFLLFGFSCATTAITATAAAAASLSALSAIFVVKVSCTRTCMNLHENLMQETVSWLCVTTVRVRWSCVYHCVQYDIIGSQFSGGRLLTRLAETPVLEADVGTTGDTRLQAHLYVQCQCQCQSNIYIAPIIEGRIWGAGMWVTRRDRQKRKGEI